MTGDTSIPRRQPENPADDGDAGWTSGPIALFAKGGTGRVTNRTKAPGVGALKFGSTPAALVRFVNRPLPSLMKSAFGPPQEVTNKSRSPSPSTSPNAAPVLDIPGAPTPASAVMFLNCQSLRFLNSPLSPSRLHR